MKSRPVLVTKSRPLFVAKSTPPLRPFPRHPRGSGHLAEHGRLGLRATSERPGPLRASDRAADGIQPNDGRQVPALSGRFAVPLTSSTARIPSGPPTSFPMRSIRRPWLSCQSHGESVMKFWIASYWASGTRVTDGCMLLRSPGRRRPRVYSRARARRRRSRGVSRNGPPMPICWMCSCRRERLGLFFGDGRWGSMPPERVGAGLKTRGREESASLPSGIQAIASAGTIPPK